MVIEKIHSSRSVKMAKLKLEPINQFYNMCYKIKENVPPNMCYK